MGLNFSASRQPQLTIEGDQHALLRVGWSYVHEHEHGFTRHFWNHLTGKTVEPSEGYPHPRGAHLVAPGRAFVSDYVHILKNEPHLAGGFPVEGPVPFLLRGIWLGGTVGEHNVAEQSRWLWESRRAAELSGVDVPHVSWCADTVGIWFRSASEMVLRFEKALSEGTAVFGLTPRVPASRGRVEPYLATSAEFAYSVLGESVYES